MTNPMHEARCADVREPLAADFIIPVLACSLAIYYLATTDDLVWEARAAGVYIGAPLIAMCVIHMARALFRIFRGEGSFSGGDLFASTLFNRQRLGLAALIALFIAVIPWIGTTLGLFLVLITSMWLLGVRHIRTLLLVAGVTCLVVYGLLMFAVGSRLPSGPGEWLLEPGFKFAVAVLTPVVTFLIELLTPVVTFLVELLTPVFSFIGRILSAIYQGLASAADWIWQIMIWLKNWIVRIGS